MHSKKIVPLILTVFLFFLSIATAGALTPEESLKKNFPDLPFDGIRPSPIKGLYEVTAGMRVFYYSPEAEILIAGQLISKDHHNLTAERRHEMVAQKVKEIPLDKALKIGSGKNQVIEFSDPNCGHCRRASEFFSKREDVTRYVFFFPLSDESEAKVRYILCSADREKAYEDAYSGKLDNQPPEVCKDAKVEELIKADKETGNRLGVEGTPFFVVNGKVVAGADLPLIEKLLTAK